MTQTPHQYDARRRLLYEALHLAQLEVGPEDETLSSTFHASVELAEEQLDRAVEGYVNASRGGPAGRIVCLRFDGPPGPGPNRFIEAENPDGSGTRVGKWRQDMTSPGDWFLDLWVVN